MGARGPNPYTLCPDGSALIYLTKGRVCVVDQGDLEQVLTFRWCTIVAKRAVYAGSRAGKGAKLILMHRFLMGNPPDQEVHHKDNDTLNNRRDNLEVLSHAEHKLHHMDERVHLRWGFN